MEHLLRDRAQEEQEPLLIRLLQGTTDLLRNVHSADQPRYKPTSTLSVDSTLMLRRVQGTLQNNWSSAIETQKPFNKLNSKRWGSHTRQEIMTVQNRAAETRTIKTATNAPLIGEEIRGLDDIFPSQITGFFDEQRPPALPAASKPAHAEQPNPEKTEQPGVSSKPSVKPMRIPVARKLREEQPALAHANALSHTIKSQLGHSDPTPDIPSEGSSDSLPEPVAPSAPLPAEAPAQQDRVSELFCTRDNKTISAKRSGYLRPFNSPDIILTNEPAHKRPAGPLKLRKIDLDDDLVADLSSFEHLARNNRILSNSISNLVDQYFHQAAQEEEEGYY